MISITCIIPVYNVEEYIIDCLQSIVNQTYTGKVECILVDDCGTDNSIRIATEFIENYRGSYEFRIIKHEKNRGLSAARNTGIINATGEYIYFLDSDDKITEDCFEQLISPLKEELYDVVVGDFKVYPQKDYHTNLKFSYNTVLRGNQIIGQYGSFNIYMMAWNKLCNRKFILDNGCLFYEGILHEDELWSYKLAVYAKSMYIVKQITYIYNLRAGSIMSSSKMQRRKEDLTIITKEIKKVADSLNLKYNYYSNRCLQNVIFKTISLSKDESEAYTTYLAIRKTLGIKMFDSLIANKRKLKLQLLDIHWMLPYHFAFMLYKKLHNLKFK